MLNYLAEATSLLYTYIVNPSNIEPMALQYVSTGLVLKSLIDCSRKNVLYDGGFNEAEGSTCRARKSRSLLVQNIDEIPYFDNDRG